MGMMSEPYSCQPLTILTAVDCLTPCGFTSVGSPTPGILAHLVVELMLADAAYLLHRVEVLWLAVRAHDTYGLYVAECSCRKGSTLRPPEESHNRD